jgi:hypothetical protein
MRVGHLSQPQSLHPCSPCGRFAPPLRRPCLLRCRSSVVEHSLGKGEVVSSILPGSTRKSPIDRHFQAKPLPFPPLPNRERTMKFPQKLGEN